MAKIEKGSDKWNVFAEVFKLYSESGEPHTDKEWDALIQGAERITDKYQKTNANKLAVKLCLAICDVAEEEYKAREKINYG